MDGAAHIALNRYRIGIHGDIHRSRQAAKQENRDYPGPDGSRPGDEKQCGQKDRRGHETDRPGAKTGDLRAGDRHENQRADTEDQDDETKRAFTKGKTRRKFGNLGRP